MATVSSLWPLFRHSDPVDTLAATRVGASVTIVAVEGDAALCFRLLELGFTPGQTLTPLARAPFGGPMAVALRGTIVALRRAEAACLRL